MADYTTRFILQEAESPVFAQTLTDPAQLPYRATAASAVHRFIISPLLFLARLSAVVLSLSLWCTVILIIWCTRVVGSVLLTSVRTVNSVWVGNGTPDTTQLQSIVVYWPRGFVAICAMLLTPDSAAPTAKPSLDNLIQEAVATVAILGLLILVNEIAKGTGGHIRWFLGKTLTWLWWIVSSAFDAIIHRLGMIALSLANLL